MKKLYLLIVSAMCLAMCACTEGDDFAASDNKVVADVDLVSESYGLTKVAIPDGVETVDVYNWADGTFVGTATVENGHIWVGSEGGWTTVSLYDATNGGSQSKTRAMAPGFSGDPNNRPDYNSGNSGNSSEDLGYLGDAVIKESSDGVISIKNADAVNSGYSSSDFLSIFPAGTDNRNVAAPAGSTSFAHDVLYVSDGTPFSVYPIYSNGWYDLTLGIFYYDEDMVRHDMNFWSMLSVNWKTPYATLAASRRTQISQYQVDKTSNAAGYEFTIPEHYVFGFYVSSNNDSQGGTFYSYSAENSCKEQHAANIVDSKGINYLSFEDQDGGDWDVNDLICYINPKVPIIENPSEESIKAELDKIGAVIVPASAEKIVHKTTDDFDIEARYDGDHKYVRISYPLNNGEVIELDLSKFDDYCEGDDTRIVTAEDVEVIYEANGQHEIKHYGNSSIYIANECADGHYGWVGACVTPDGGDGNDPDGKYELKVEMYLKSEDCFDKVATYIKDEDWDKLFKCVKTKN